MRSTRWIVALALAGCTPSAPDEDTASTTNTTTPGATVTGEATTAEPTTAEPTTADPTTGEPTSTTATSTTATSTSTGEPTTDGTTGAPGACEAAPSPSMWTETIGHETDDEGELVRSLALDGLGRLHFVTQGPPGAPPRLHRREPDGAGATTTVLPVPGDIGVLDVAVSADGETLYLALGERVTAIEGDAVLWEQDSPGPSLNRITADPSGGAIALAELEPTPFARAFDAAGAPRWTYAGEGAATIGGTAGIDLAWTPEGHLLLAYASVPKLGEGALALEKLDPADGGLVWRRAHLRGNNTDEVHVSAADDGSIYLTGLEFSLEQMLLGEVYVHRLDATGELLWSKIYVDWNDALVLQDNQPLALAGGDVLAASASVPTLFRFDAAGELVGELPLADPVPESAALALRRDPCGGAVFLRADKHYAADDQLRDLYTIGRLPF